MTERLLSAIDWHLGHVVRRLRLADGLTQAEIAESTGLALSKIQRLEDRGEAPRATPLELTLLDADGVPLRGRGAALGPALAPEVLRVAAPQEIRQRQAALAAEQAALDPGESRRFAAIFAAVPDAASKLRVRLLGE